MSLNVNEIIKHLKSPAGRTTNLYATSCLTCSLLRQPIHALSNKPQLLPPSGLKRYVFTFLFISTYSDVPHTTCTAKVPKDLHKLVVKVQILSVKHVLVPLVIPDFSDEKV